MCRILNNERGTHAAVARKVSGEFKTNPTQEKDHSQLTENNCINKRKLNGHT
jgi:hypothetical protein